MARFIKQFDPEETQRRIAVEIQESHCPGLLEFLSTLQYGQEGPGLRAIVYQWFLDREADGTLHSAFETVVNGPGGLSGTRLQKAVDRPKRRTSSKPAVQANRPKRAPRATEEMVTPFITPAVPVTNVEMQEAAHARFPSGIVPPLPVAEMTPHAQQPQAITVVPSIIADPPMTTASSEDGGTVDLEKISPVIYEALMNLDTMFD